VHVNYQLTAEILIKYKHCIVVASRLLIKNLKWHLMIFTENVAQVQNNPIGTM